MHELSVAQAIVDTATRHAGGRRVTLVTLRLGTLRQVVFDSLAFYFEIVARDTLCEGAELEHEPVAARLRCPDCGFEWDPAPPPLATHGPAEGVPALPTFRCPDCGTPGEVEAGGELEVESIEVSDAAEASVG
jgi:hydrogenase nickel incorporation protein HypA/HybF